ncbi:MAG: S53 family peptidase, partial [Actinomycetota bacterium]
MRRFTLIAAVMASAASLGPARSGPLAPSAVHSVPSWAVPHARVGGVPADEPVTLHVVLPWRNEAEARRNAKAVSDPRSPRYAKYMTPSEFRARFAPPASTVSAIGGWLHGAGLQIGFVPDNNLVIPARGPAAAVERAFAVTLGRYRVAGTTLRAPDAEPVLPAVLTRNGATVRGFHEGDKLISPGHIDEFPPPPTLPEDPATALDSPRPNAVVYAPPCSAFDGEKTNKKLPPYRGARHPAVVCATTPRALQAAYGLTPLLKQGIDGTGETIVMVGSHSIRTLEEDVEEWSRRRRLPPMFPGQLRQFSHPGSFYAQDDPTGSVLRPSVWAVQSAMLIETMRAIAPGASYIYAGSATSFDLPYMTLLAINGRWGDVIVNGWYTLNEDDTETDTLLISRMGLQAANTGISLLFASGDLGDGTHHGNTAPSVAYPAHNPDVTAVGATSLILGRGGKYAGELGWAKSVRRLEKGKWNEPIPADFRGSGGGASHINAMPDYQSGVVPESLATHPDGFVGRAVPDIAVAGDAETGMLIGYTQRFPDGSVRYS